MLFSQIEERSDTIIQNWMFDLPAMPLGGLGRMSWRLGPVTMIMPPSFVMHGRRVFDVHPFGLLIFFLVPMLQRGNAYHPL